MLILKVVMVKNRVSKCIKSLSRLILPHVEGAKTRRVAA